MNRGLIVAAVITVASSLALAGCSASSGSAAEIIQVTGDIATHDPALYVGEEGEPWYVFSTGDIAISGGAPQIRRSVDEGRTWEFLGGVWERDTAPEWVYEVVPNVTNFWAPDIAEHDGTYYLYYSASTFGLNTSVIGLMTNTTLDPDSADYAWVDQGEVIRSEWTDDFNAIDPSVVTAEDGTPWMAFGSFWSGIQLLQLEWPSGKVADGAEQTIIAARTYAPNAIEGPALYYHDGYYYLFVSRDSCCQGTDSTYNIGVGRSENIAGPYVDPDGVPMTEDGHLSLLSTTGAMVGPGGQSISKNYMAYHYYDADAAGNFKLAIRSLGWDSEGWPILRVEGEEAQSE